MSGPHQGADGGSGALVIGIGNGDRGDDAAGLEVARRVRARLSAAVMVRESAGEAAGLIEAWSGADPVVVVDAAAGGRVGDVHRIEAHAHPLPATLGLTSSHSFGLPEAVSLSKALGRLPARLVVYAIMGRRFDPGQPLSPEVDAAVDSVVERVARDLSSA